MLKIILSGCNGHMGRVVTSIVEDDPDVEIVAGFDISAQSEVKYPVFATPAEYDGIADIIVDFSNPSTLDDLLEYASSKKIPLVLCATGYDQDQIAAIKNTSESIAVLRSGNMSVGINLLVDLIQRSCTVLGEDFDVEIVERHHRRKVDAPSGTALLLADAASDALPYDARYVYERESQRKPREPHEIGISAVRGGTIVGVHDVIFAGLDEVIEIRHTAASRDIFAVGALRAAKYLFGKPPGMYSMKDVLRDV